MGAKTLEVFTKSAPESVANAVASKVIADKSGSLETETGTANRRRGNEPLQKVAKVIDDKKVRVRVEEHRPGDQQLAKLDGYVDHTESAASQVESSLAIKKLENVKTPASVRPATEIRQEAPIDRKSSVDAALVSDIPSINSTPVVVIPTPLKIERLPLDPITLKNAGIAETEANAIFAWYPDKIVTEKGLNEARRLALKAFGHQDGPGRIAPKINFSSSDVDLSVFLTQDRHARGVCSRHHFIVAMLIATIAPDKSYDLKNGMKVSANWRNDWVALLPDALHHCLARAVNPDILIDEIYKVAKADAFARGKPFPPEPFEPKIVISKSPSIIQK